AGCGLGHHTRRLVDRGVHVTAVDFSPSAVRATQARVPEADCREADLTALPFEDRGFDSVLCYGVLMHIPNVRAAIGELARVAGRTLIISESNMRSVDGTLVRLFALCA